MSRTIPVLLLTLCVAISCAADEGTDADYAARMAREHAGDQPTPGAAAGDPGQISFIFRVRDDAGAQPTFSGLAVRP